MRDGYGRGGPCLLYSCVGIRAGRFICFVLTLKAAMIGEVHSRCSHMLVYEGQVRRVGPRTGRFVEAFKSLRPALVCILYRAMCFSYFHFNVLRCELGPGDT